MAVQGKSTFGTRMPLDIHMLNEMIAREMKHYKAYTTYQPNFGCQPITSKFYAHHDQFIVDSKEQAKHIEDYHHHVQQNRAKGPHCKYKLPITENQEYGWHLNTKFITTNRNDSRFFKPIVESSHTKIMNMILTMNEGNKSTK